MYHAVVFLINRGSEELILQIDHINKSYGDVSVLRDVSMHVDLGEFVGIIGRSGAGKSTLLHIAGTLDKPDTGEVWIDGHQMSQLKGKDLAKFRNESIGFIFQFHHLLPEFTAEENVMIPALIGGQGASSARKKARDLLEAVGLSTRFHHKPGGLSGGEQQRVAIARAMINSPKILFADEPTGNLDSASADEVHALFLELNQSFNQTLIIVTHNPRLSDICSRIVRMHDGIIIEDS